MKMKRIDFYGQPVKLLVTRNPKKKGSAAHARFEDYFDLPDDATVGHCLTKTRIRMDDIRHDSEHGFIAVGKEAIKFAEQEAALERAAAIEAAKALLAEVEAEAEEEVEEPAE